VEVMSAPTAMIGQDLYYHGKSLLTEFSCIAEKWPEMEMGSPSYTEHVVIGVDGKLYQSDRRDTDTVLTFTCLFHVRQGYTYRDTYREIRDWVYSPGEEILRESRNSGHFWKVKKATVSPIKPTSNHAASFELTFVVEDHEYLDDGTEDIELEVDAPEDELIILLEDRTGATFYLTDTETGDQNATLYPMLSHPAWVIQNEHAEACPIWYLRGEYGFALIEVDSSVSRHIDVGVVQLVVGKSCVGVTDAFNKLAYLLKLERLLEHIYDDYSCELSA
jgi:hypothetical protein